MSFEPIWRHWLFQLRFLPLAALLASEGRGPACPALPGTCHIRSSCYLDHWERSPWGVKPSPGFLSCLFFFPSAALKTKSCLSFVPHCVGESKELCPSRVSLIRQHTPTSNILCVLLKSKAQSKDLDKTLEFTQRDKPEPSLTQARSRPQRIRCVAQERTRRKIQAVVYNCGTLSRCSLFSLFCLCWLASVVRVSSKKKF